MTKATNSELLTALNKAHERLTTLQNEKDSLFEKVCEQRIELALSAEKIKHLEERCLNLESELKAIESERNKLADTLEKKRINANEASKRSHAKKRAEKSGAVPATPKTPRKKKPTATP